jgi:APA family basic amino acid/polyamine antiporter
MSSLLQKKPISGPTSDSPNQLKRVMGPVSLTAMGIGAVIGAGIFVATGEAAKNVAGPALMVSYIVSGVVCLLAALCYAEFAAMTPVAGSAYTYTYTSLGEIFAWIIGWDLILEYAVGAATVANGWSGYFEEVIGMFGAAVPEQLRSAPLNYNLKSGSFEATGSVINLPALLVVLLLTTVLIKGIKESAMANAVMVAIKIGAVLFVIVVGSFLIVPANWSNFAPYGWTGVNFFGLNVAGGTNDKGAPAGMLAGAALIFFAYIGFDAVSTQAEEAKNPQRDLPIGILVSLLICTALYVAVVAVLTGMVNWSQLSETAGVSDAFKKAGYPRAEFVIAVAGVAGISSVLLVMLLGSARILMAMSRDGLLPPFFSAIHPSFRTPWKGTIVVGVFVAAFAALFPLGLLLEMTNIGTLFAFSSICGAVLVMRYTNPGVHRPFRCPLVPVVPILGVLSCLLLMFSLPAHNWYRLFGWMTLGLVFYFAYGRKHSCLRMTGEKSTASAQPQK